MGVILPFKRPERILPEPFQVKTADGSMSSNPMRRLVYRVCQSCQHEYVQAALTGRCPVCHIDTVSTVKISACVAPYRK